jgi:hypothetical protein
MKLERSTLKLIRVDFFSSLASTILENEEYFFALVSKVLGIIPHRSLKEDRSVR